MASHLILAGPTRTGTTSLFRYLATQGAFVPSREKETDFFLGAIRGVDNFSYGDYLSNFEESTTDAWRLEASPLYFAGVRNVAEAIRTTIPESDDVRIVITVREPVDRLISLHRHVVTKRNLRSSLEPVTFAAFLDECLRVDAWQFPLAGSINQLGFVEGCYSNGIRQWVEVFGEQRVRLLCFEDLKDEDRSVAAMTALYEWLGLTGLRRVAMLRENQSRQVRFPNLHRIALSVNDRLEASLTARPGLRNAIRDMYYSLVQTKRDLPDAVSPAVRDSLRQNYSDCNSDLAEWWRRLRLGENTPSWLTAIREVQLSD